MRKRYQVLLLLLGALGILAGEARADSVLVTENYYQGSRSTLGTLDGTGLWASAEGSFKIEWDITKAFENGEWVFTYDYTLTRTVAGGVSHAIFETSANFQESDLRDGSDEPLVGPTTFYPTDDKGSQPNMPGSIFGLKFDSGTEDTVITYTLRTIRVPVWGDFYSKDGSAGPGNEFNAIWNTGFGTDPTLATADFSGWIPTPDTFAVPVPLPGAALAGIGLIGGIALNGVRRKWNAKA